MPTPTTKAKDGLLTAETAADAAYKVTEEAREMMDSFANAVDKATEDGYALIEAQQKIWRTTLDVWQQYNKRYLDFMTEAMQKGWEQSFAQWEQIGKLMANNFTKAQELMMAEQELILETSEASRKKMQTTGERFTRLFTPDLK